LGVAAAVASLVMRRAEAVVSEDLVAEALEVVGPGAGGSGVTSTTH